MNKDFKAYNISDLRELARKRLPKGLFEYVDRGTEDEVSLRNNRAVFERLRLRPRTMVNVSKRNLQCELFGTQYKLPVGIAPTGSAGLMWYEGEIALARAAREAGVPFTLSTSSLTAMERVAAEAGGDIWFQLYFWPDRSMSAQLVERVLDHFGTDEVLLFSTDYPHWHFEGQDVVPEGFSPDLIRKIAIDNPYAVYRRLQRVNSQSTASEVTA